MTEKYPPTPECDKIVDVQDKSQILSEFVDWLDSKGYAICIPEETSGYPREQWISIRKPFEELFADYFGVDLKRAEQERQAILAHIRG